MHVEHLTFRSGDVVLAGTLTLPVGPTSAPGVILASGSGHHDRDETVCGKKPFKVIAEYMASRGHAVLRFDDRGVGESEGVAEEATFESSVMDLIAAYDHLSRDPRVASNRIVLLGHSEGGLTAAEAASHTGSAVVMLAGPAVPIDDLLHRQAWLISSEGGATDEQLQHERRMNTRVFELVRGADDPSSLERPARAVIEDHLRTWPGYPAGDPGEVSATAKQMAAIVTAPDYRSLLTKRPHEILSKLKSPVLALFGELDAQVEARSNLSAFRQATKGNASAHGHIFPGLNHLFQRARTGSIQEYEELGDSPASEVLQYLDRWLEGGIATADA